MGEGDGGENEKEEGERVGILEREADKEETALFCCWL